MFSSNVLQSYMSNNGVKLFILNCTQFLARKIKLLQLYKEKVNPPSIVKVNVTIVSRYANVMVPFWLTAWEYKTMLQLAQIFCSIHMQSLAAVVIVKASLPSFL